MNLIFIATFITSAFAINPPVPIDWTQTDQLNIVKQILIQRRNEIKKWSTHCLPGQRVDLPAPYSDIVDSRFDGQFSNESNSCGHGDLMIFGGFSSLGAWFAGDTDWALARHQDQHLSQEPSGLWVRGPSWVGLTQAANPFSRDQGTGLRMYFTVALDRIKKEKNPAEAQLLKKRYQNEFYQWLHWIEFEGNGKMCKGDQRCSINGFFGSSLYRIAQEIGAINSTNQNWKVVKQLKMLSKTFRGASWASETSFTPIDYQMLLKMADLLIESYLGILDQRWLKMGAHFMYLKDPGHALYQFLYEGTSPHLIEKLLAQCPVMGPDGNRHTYQWMHRSINRTYAELNGHDCLLLMNLMIAHFDGKLSWLPNHLTDDTVNPNQSCPTGKKKVGTYGFLPVCQSSLPIKNFQCGSTGIRWKDQAQNQNCIHLKKGYYLARKIKAECPIGSTYEGNENWSAESWPMCKSKLPIPISRVECSTHKVIWAGQATFKKTINGQEYCGLPKSGWYALRPITKECPMNRKYLGTMWDWPVCEKSAAIRIERSKCPHLSDGSQQNFMSPIDGHEYCINQKLWHFTAQPF